MATKVKELVEVIQEVEYKFNIRLDTKSGRFSCIIPREVSGLLNIDIAELVSKDMTEIENRIMDAINTFRRSTIILEKVIIVYLELNGKCAVDKDGNEITRKDEKLWDKFMYRGFSKDAENMVSIGADIAIKRTVDGVSDIHDASRVNESFRRPNPENVIDGYECMVNNRIRNTKGTVIPYSDTAWENIQGIIRQLTAASKFLMGILDTSDSAARILSSPQMLSLNENND